MIAPLILQNYSSNDGFFELAVRGIPSTWVSVPSPVIRLAAGEQRQVSLTIQPPLPPQGRAGRHQVVVRVTSQATPEVTAEGTCTLTVAALEVPGRIGLLLAATEFPVVPGEGVTVPLVLYNQGLERDIVNLSVEGIPSSWVYASSTATALTPGQQQEVVLTVQPPRSSGGAAGRRPFQILASSQAAPGQVARADCILSIAPFSRFRSELRPQRIEAGQPARVMVENQSNVQQAFTVTWQSPDETLEFEPAATQELRLAPGEMGMAEFRARPRSRPLLGREQIRPFTARVQAAEGDARSLTGEVASKPLIPSWVLPAVAVAIVAIVSIMLLLTVLGGSPQGGAPPDVAVPTVTPGAEQPRPTEPPTERPTDLPPEEPTDSPPEQPTEPPPEQPTEVPPEQPTEPSPEQPTTDPPAEDPPAAGPLPAEPEEGGLPCAPLATGLVLAPVLVFGKKSHR